MRPGSDTTWIMGNTFNRMYFSIFDMSKFNRRIGFVGHAVPEKTFPIGPLMTVENE